MHIIHSFGHLIGGILLIAGTSIGVGMLALPIATAQGGFFPALFVYGLCWFFMLCTGLLILEACIWMPKDANLITLSSRLLGRWGKISCWVLYLFLFSCLMIAHVEGGGNVVADLTSQHLPFWASTLLYVAAFAPIVYLGTKWVDRLNIVIISGVVLTYFTFLFTCFSYVTPSFLLRMDWRGIWAALPVVFTAFGYQSLIPTLFNYMNRDVKKMRLALIIGTSIPLVLYIFWELLILGIIPLEGVGGLAAALKKGASAVSPLGDYIHNPHVLTAGQAFAFFAMTTSFLGISIAFLDFLSDGLKLKKTALQRLGLCALLFGIPTIVTLNPTHSLH